MRIIFMGTPDFAVATLEALVQNNFEVVAVVTAPDKPTGRGQKMNESPVKKYAFSQNIPVLQPEKLKNPSFIETLKSYRADLQVVVAFRMLPEMVWSMPSKGTVNLHGSLLPQYRGAAPINWAIINGETQTGVTTFFIEKEIDTGNIILTENIEIKPEENAGSLHDKMMVIGAELMVKTLNLIASGKTVSYPQDFSKELKPAPKIFKETCEINWKKNTKEIYNLIRGMCPYPAAYTFLNDKILKILECKMVESIPEISEYNYKNDTIKLFTDRKKNIFFKTSDGYISVLTLQLEGKKRMDVEEFLRGFREF